MDWVRLVTMEQYRALIGLMVTGGLRKQKRPPTNFDDEMCLRFAAEAAFCWKTDAASTESQDKVRNTMDTNDHAVAVSHALRRHYPLAYM